MERLLVALYKRREVVERAMELANTQVLEEGRALAEAGAGAFFVEECFALPDTVSPRVYTEAVLPAEKRLIGALRSLGLPVILSSQAQPYPS